MYMSLMELVKAEVQVPRLMRKPPIITTGRWPKRLLSMVATGATVGEEGHYSDGAFPPKIVPLCLSDCATMTSSLAAVTGPEKVTTHA